jgi:hypothetical protein
VLDAVDVVVGPVGVPRNEVSSYPRGEEVGLRSFTSRTGYPVDSLLVPAWPSNYFSMSSNPIEIVWARGTAHTELVAPPITIH